MRTGLAACAATCVLLAQGASPGPVYPKEKLKPEQLVASHLSFLGQEAARVQRNSSAAHGTGQLSVMVGAERPLAGSAKFLSQGPQFRFSMLFSVSDYPSEEFSFDGKKTYVSQLRPGIRSQIGQFLYSYESLLKEGLLGGVLSTAWPLLDLSTRKPNLRYRGVEEIEGRTVHDLEYRIRRGGQGLRIHLYFDTQSFAHLQTTYQLEIPDAPLLAPGRSTSAAARAADSPRQMPTRFLLDERFGQFRRVGDVMLPFQWRVRLTTERRDDQLGGVAAASRNLSVLEWLVTFDRVELNAEIDPKTFVLYD